MSFIRVKSILSFACLCYCVLAGNDCEDASDKDDAPQWIRDGGFLVLLLGVCAMFWGLALVCEEYFVPALNIMCEEANIPDDVAGATFMAAGASSPEMFTSFIALFVNHSAIGVGTVVGSEIFNHMIICAGSVMYSSTGVLQLEKRVFSRDVVAYFVCLIVLIWSLKGSVFGAIAQMFSKGEREECLQVTVYHASALVLLYVAYAVISANFQWIIRNCFPLVEEDETVSLLVAAERVKPSELYTVTEDEEAQADSSDHVVDFLANMTTPIVDGKIAGGGGGARKGFTNSVRSEVDQGLTPVASQSMSLRRSMQLQRSLKYNPDESQRDHSTRLAAVDWSASRATFIADTPLYTWRSSAVHTDPLVLDESAQQALVGQVQMKTAPLLPAPNGIQSIYRMAASKHTLANLSTMSVSDNSVSMYLYCKEAGGRWSLRYFTLDRLGFYSRKAHSNPIRGPHIKLLSLANISEAKYCDGSDNSFKLFRRGHGNSEEVCWEMWAPTTDICSTIFKRLMPCIQSITNNSAANNDEQERITRRVLEGGWYDEDSGGEENHGCLLDKPKYVPGDPYGVFAVLWHYIVYPLKFLFYHTLADVHSKGGRDKYVGCLVMCIFWLAILSFVMIQCCDNIGDFIGASPIVMGLTVSAVGTSFPNLWSSMLVARQGLGDMAVSNAFGSNTFNICIALGLPWLTHVLAYGLSPYDKMQDDNIVFMLLLLIAALVVFYLVVMFHHWQIRLWMSYYFIGIYIGIMVYAIING